MPTAALKTKRAPVQSIISPSFQLVILGAAGGPLEDNITGLLLRSTSTNWAKDSVLAVDAGSHLASISRILDASIPPEAVQSPIPGNRRASPRKPKVLQQAQVTHPVDAAHIPTTAPAALSFRIPGPNPTSHWPFSQLAALLPFSGSASSVANAAHIVRSYISTYLITHAHLDHVSGLIVNTASFQHQYRTRRIAALPSTIQALKNHIFNDVIWPNMSDEDGGIGLVSYMRLTEGGNVAAGSGDGKGYVEVCEGLTAKGYHISHGHCFRQPSRDNGVHHEGLDELSDDAMALAAARAAANASLSMGSADTGNKLSRMNVYDSSMFFVRDQATGMEVAVFGDVEPDVISAEPRNERVWDEAAAKFVSGRLRGVVIECSYDDTQGDDVLFGHVNPRHLMAELGVLAGKVMIRRRKAEDQDSEVKIGGRDRRGSSRAGKNGRSDSPNHQGEPTAVEDTARKRKRVNNDNAGWIERGFKLPPTQSGYRGVRPRVNGDAPGSSASEIEERERRRSSLGALVNLQQQNDQRAESMDRQRRSSSGVHTPHRHSQSHQPQARHGMAPPLKAPSYTSGKAQPLEAGSSPQGRHKGSADSGTSATTGNKRPSTEMSFTGNLTPPQEDFVTVPTHQPGRRLSPRSQSQKPQQPATSPEQDHPAGGVAPMPRKTWEDDDCPLLGLPIVIIHMKETLDGRPEGVGDRIRRDLEDWEAREWKLGVQFFVTHVGMSLWL